MRQIKREDVHIFNKYSNISSSAVRKALEDQVYHQPPAWNHFVKWFLLSLGVGFTLSGIIFFFAYNWAELSKFTKFGLAQGLLVVCAVSLWILRDKKHLQQIVLTAMAVITGLLFALFGQIYQTGANAYDLFLSWTLFITLWLIVSNFAPLWLIYLTLVNTTIVLYAQQIATHWDLVFLMSILILFNSLCLLLGKWLDGKMKLFIFPIWLENILALAVGFMAIIGVVNVVYEPFQLMYSLFLGLVTVFYVLAYYNAFQNKRVFYIALVNLSLIVITSAILLKFSDAYFMMLIISIFIIVGVTLTIKYILGLQKRWSYE